MEHPVGPTVARQVGEADGLRFDRLWDLALYEPGLGFYDTGGAAGRRADFLTSVELGPLFGACVARRLDQAWDEAGRPDRWTLVDVGAGPGTLVRSVLAASPRCLPVLEAVMVERTATQRAGHGQVIAWAGERGVEVRSQAELPDRVDGLILAHELLDNLASRVVQRRGGDVQELWATPISAADAEIAESSKGTIELSWRPLDADDRRLLAGLEWWASVPDEAPVPWCVNAAPWVDEARRRLASGTLVVVDYGTRTTAELARRDGWLRTYAEGAVGTDPLEELGRRDLTCDVPFDQLPVPDRLETQADALVGWGIDRLVAAARERLAQRSPGSMDLDWARDTSVLNEAPALVDPGGLGAFLVAEWTSGGGPDV